MQNEQNQSKYPWHLAPDWVKYAVEDHVGDKYWLENEPFLKDGYWCLTPADPGRKEKIKCPSNNWQESLEKRPLKSQF
jgi:hypothetical protein